MSICKEDFCGKHNKRFRSGERCPECTKSADVVGGAIYEESCHIAQDDERAGTLTTHAERFRRLGAAALRVLGK